MRLKFFMNSLDDSSFAPSESGPKTFKPLFLSSPANFLINSFPGLQQRSGLILIHSLTILFVRDILHSAIWLFHNFQENKILFHTGRIVKNSTQSMFSGTRSYNYDIHLYNIIKYVYFVNNIPNTLYHN